MKYDGRVSRAPKAIVWIRNVSANESKEVEREGSGAGVFMKCKWNDLER